MSRPMQTMSLANKIYDNLLAIRQEIPSTVSLIAVSKYATELEINYAYQAGQRDFGESRVLDLARKATYFADKEDIRWHFIGHLQSNKINNLLKIKNLAMIHSIDSFKQLEMLLGKAASFDGKALAYFLQANTSEEKEKFGMDSLNEIFQCVKLAQEYASAGHRKFHLTGLMTIGKIRTDDFVKDANSSFAQLVAIRQQIQMRARQELGVDISLKLSMGMSNDYKIAIAHGSDYLRVGSAIFESNA